MAEARQAVGFRLVVSQDGKVELDFDWAAFLLVLNSAKRSIKKRHANFINNLKTAIFPLRLELLTAHVTLLTAVHLAGLDLTFGLTQKIISQLCLLL